MNGRQAGLAAAMGLVGLLIVPALATAQEHHRPGQAPSEEQGMMEERGMMGTGCHRMMEMMEMMRGHAMVDPGMMGMGPGMMGMMGMDHRTMGLGMAPMGPGSAMGTLGSMGASGPGALLMQKEALGLDGSQVQRLETLRTELGAAHEAHAARLGEIRDRLAEIRRAEKPDLARLESALQEMAEEGVKMQVEVARAGERAMEILTPEQRGKVRYGMAAMREMMGGMRRHRAAAAQEMREMSRSPMHERMRYGRPEAEDRP